MKIKTSELIGPALDWAVAKCEGFKPCAVFGRGTVKDNGFAIPAHLGHRAALLRPAHDRWVAKCEDYPWGANQVVWEPTKKWAQAGPIIERECIAIYASGACSVLPKNPDYWVAEILDTSEILTQYGPTPLIAAMRCYIASKLGDIVDVPDEILSR